MHYLLQKEEDKLPFPLTCPLCLLSFCYLACHALLTWHLPASHVGQELQHASTASLHTCH